jgi:tetratricopeptide (TPR) repeat protein
MQRDVAPQDNFVKFLAWVQVNQKRLILWGALVIAVILAVVSVVAYQRQKETAGSLALSSVYAPLSPSTPMPPGTADAYLKVANEHNGTKAGARALLLAGATFFSEKNYAEAQKLFERFLKEYPDNEFVPNAHYGIAATLDAQGKTAEATAKFEQIRRVYASDSIIDETKLALARLYENQNKAEEAHKLYTEVLQSNPGQYSGIGNEAGMRREELEAKYPQLVKTNAPILPPALSILTNPPAMMTNRLGATNQVLTLSNRPAVRIITNPGAVKPETTAPTQGTNTPLLIQPVPTTPPAPKP